MSLLSTGITAEVHPSRVDPSAALVGQTLVEGLHTRIGAGAVIQNSYLRNVVVEPGARIVDSVVVATQDRPHSHVRPGFAGRWAIQAPFPPVIGTGARVMDSTIRDASIGAHSTCDEAFIGGGTVGPRNVLARVYAETIQTGPAVRIQGPTEISEAWLGHHATIDACGYFEGFFSNDFYVLEFHEGTGRLVVREILDVPHVSRYGQNTICSTNSGNLLDPSQGVLRSLGPHRGLWEDVLLSHEPMILGPCCWVAGWTKVIGKSATAHGAARELLADPLATQLSPFSVSGLGGGSVSGLVLPGERHDAPLPRHRLPGWTFTYAPGAIFAAVERVTTATGDSALADRLPMLALRSALALVRAQAAARGVPLAAASASSHGWPGWLAAAHRTLSAHLTSGLWAFSGGEPVAWRRQGRRWVPTKAARLTAIAPDALTAQVDEAALITCEHEPLARTLGATATELAATHAPTSIDPAATVAPDAVIGPGVQIRGASSVAAGAWLAQAVIDNASVGAGARVLRSAVSRTSIEADATVLSSRLSEASLGPRSAVTCARVVRSTLAGAARVSPYALIEDSRLAFPCIVGSNLRRARVDTTFMSYHMPGQVEELVVEPTYVTVSGRRVAVAAVPMLGGGLRVLGDARHPVTMECAFIGSNAILEGGAFVGFGSFVLGRLSGIEGLPPFTVSTGPGPHRDQIGQVVHQFANMVITHFINWAYQALGPDQADAVGLLVPTMLADGRAAVAWALECQPAGAAGEPPAPFARYRSLGMYSREQLAAGLDAYDRALADGRWQMRYVEGQLRFTGPGRWEVAAGVARWRPERPAP